MAPKPSDRAIEDSLRQAVRAVLDRAQNVSVNEARTIAEQQLGLKPGFLKSEQKWKQKSKEIVHHAVEHPDLQHTGSADSSPDSRKRAREISHDRQTKSKRRRTALAGSNDESNSSSPPPRKPVSKKRTGRKKSLGEEEAESDNDLSELSLSTPEPDADNEEDSLEKEEHKLNDDGDDSDMSVLIDEPPKRARNGQKSKSAVGVRKGKKDKQDSTATSKALSPDEEMVKTLQSQLLKCGIRKLWHRELEHCRNDKEKIRHLKKMLEDAGMVGRFSAAKASQIKEARELAADLESAREFSRTWGTEGGRAKRHKASRNVRMVQDSSEDEEESAVEVKAGAATGLVDFGDSGDDGSD